MDEPQRARHRSQYAGRYLGRLRYAGVGHYLYFTLPIPLVRFKTAEKGQLALHCGETLSMGWATPYIAQLQQEETVQFRPRNIFGIVTAVTK